MNPIGLIGFVAVGLSLGLLGGGGSILAVPVLVYAFGLPAGVAVPMSLPVVGLAAAVGAWARWRRGQLRVPTALGFAAVAMVTSFGAARFGADIPDRTRLLLFVTVMLIAATMMWHRSRRPIAGEPIPTAAPANGPSMSPTLVVVAAVVGTLTGLVGVGGGFLIVPALVGVLAISMPEASATSLAVIALNTVAAGAGWWGRVDLDLPLTANVTIAALLGMVLGTRLAPRFSARTLTRAFAVLLIVVGTFMVYEQLK